MTANGIQIPARKGPRTELKFVLPVADAQTLMSRWRSMLEPDPHVADKSDPIYRVHSIYFDTPKRHAIKGRGFPKHRLRRYDDHPVRFLEEKYSRGSAVWKRRLGYEGTDLPEPTPVTDLEHASNPQLAWFMHRFHTLELTPQVEISYDRYALVGEDDLRITCDFSPGARPTGNGQPMISLLEDEAILEIKHAGAPGTDGRASEPFLNELAREAVSFSKYARGLRRLEGWSLPDDA